MMAGAAGAFGGLARPRIDQGLSSSPGVVPAPSGNFLGHLVIIFGTGSNVGFFYYNGSPALGNLPTVYIAPPGVTQDPYGNPLPTTTGGINTVRYAGTTPEQISQLIAGVLNLWGGPVSIYTAPGRVSVPAGDVVLALSSPTSAALPATAELDLAAGAPGAVSIGTSNYGYQSQYSIAYWNGIVAETWHQVSPTLAGWNGFFGFRRLPTGEISGGLLSGPLPSDVFYVWKMPVANGTVLTPGNIIFPAGTMPVGTYLTTDTNQLPTIFTGGGAGAPLITALSMTAAGSLHYSGTAFTLTANGFMYGQALISTAL